MSFDVIDYGKLVDDAMHIIVANVLKLIPEKGLPGNHHFFIAFITKHPGVKISKALENKYPREMTIVLQYQFQDLEVTDQGFSVTLSFGGMKEKISIPFAAITTFADPSVQFGLQFREVNYEYTDEIDVDVDTDDEDVTLQDKPAKPAKVTKKSKKNNNVVSLDKFRDKKK
ncbi:MAG: SspB family protein [Alphaproteobacteria bacterium]